MRPHGAVLAQSRHCTAANLHKPHNSQSVCLGALEKLQSRISPRPSTQPRLSVRVRVPVCAWYRARLYAASMCVSSVWSSLILTWTLSASLGEPLPPFSVGSSELRAHLASSVRPDQATTYTHTRAHTKTRLLEYRREPDLKSRLYLS